MKIITFSDKPSPFEPVHMSRIATDLAIQVALEIRKNKKKEMENKEKATK